MRLYRGDITKTYDREIYPLGSVSYIDGNQYRFVKANGAITIKKWDAIQIDTSNVVTLANGTVVDGVCPIDVVLANGETAYFWVQTGGNAYVAVDDAESGDLTGNLIDCTAEAGRASAYVFVASTEGDPTNAELNAMLVVARTCKVVGASATTTTEVEKMGDVDTSASYDNTATTVNGSGTLFTKWFDVGDKIVLNGTELTITAITDDTTMTVSGGSADISATDVYRKRRVAACEIDT